MNNYYNGSGGGMPYGVPQPQYGYQQQQMTPFVQVPQNTVEQERPHIKKFMREFNENSREDFNEFWFHRDTDAIADGIEKVILSCQRDKYFTLRVLSFRLIKDYEEIHRLLRAKYAGRTKNGKKIENPYDFISLRDSDISLLVVRYYIRINRPKDQIRIDSKTKLPEKLEGEEEVLVAIPRYVNGYYFRLQGNYYAPMFQIVDGSTYNNSTSNSKAQIVILKSRFMPIKMYREYYDLIDITTEQPVRSCLYSTYIFSKKNDACKYILGRYGLYGAMELLELQQIYVSNSIMDNDDYYNFRCKDKCTVVSVPKMLMEDAVVQSFVVTLCKAICAKHYDNWTEIYDPRFWNKSLGGDFMSFTLDKGIPVLDSIESIYDLQSKKDIHLPDEEKCDVYHIIRWMMREFSALRLKDNLDISTKRAKMADQYLDCLYAMKLSRGIYRTSDKGKSVRYMDVKKAIDIDANYIISKINKTNLVNYVNAVNDNDAEIALEYTYKGITGLGDQGPRSAIPTIFRMVHPSHIGRVDLDSSSASDPGLSGTIVPTAVVTEDGSFQEYEESNTWKENFDQMVNEHNNLTGMIQLIELKKNLGLSYDYVKEDMVRETLTMYNKLICPIIDIDGKIDYSLNESINYSIKGNNPESDDGDIVFSTEKNIYGPVIHTIDDSDDDEDDIDEED